MRSPKNRDPERQEILMILFSGRTVEECLGRQLIGFVRDSDAPRSRCAELEEQYQSLFGASVESCFIPDVHGAALWACGAPNGSLSRLAIVVH